MAKRGVDASWQSASVLQVPAGDYLPGDAVVEGDATAASYFAALRPCTVATSPLAISAQIPARVIINSWKSCSSLVPGSNEQTTPPALSAPEQMRPLAEIDMNPMPDAALTLITLAPLLPGGGYITGLSSLHHKECDRLECPAAQYRLLGIEAVTSDASINVRQTAPEQIRPHILETYHDHRMAMAFSIIGSVTGTLTVDDAEVVNKTYPNYWRDYRSLIA